MFAIGINLYSLIAVDAVTAFSTLFVLLRRRKPPTLLMGSSVLFAGAVLSLFLPVRAAGDKLGGAVVVMFFFPTATLLVLAASVCSLAWVTQWITRPRREVRE
jgi:hypothetical protein